MKILVTGHTGFIGKNLLNKIKNKSDNKIIFGFDSSNDFNYLEKISRKIDTIVYLAGVQRPKNETDFNKINYDLLKNMFTQNEWPNLRKVIFSSSVHVDLHPDSIYSISKKKAEIFLMNYCESNSIYLKIYRFNNLFGPFGKVNYNSVVANFSYAISHDQAINISNPNQQITLNYISDAVEGIYNDIIDNKSFTIEYGTIKPSYTLTLGDLFCKIYKIHKDNKIDSNISKKLSLTYNWYRNIEM